MEPLGSLVHQVKELKKVLSGAFFCYKSAFTMLINPLRTKVYVCHQNQNAKNGNFTTLLIETP
jgi:hypothetical protein